MGAGLAIAIGVIGVALIAVLLRGLWRVKIPTFGTRVRRGEWADVSETSGASILGWLQACKRS